VAIAGRRSSRAARRAGRSPAIKPTSAPTARIRPSRTTGIENAVSVSPPRLRTSPQPRKTPRLRPERPEDRDDDRLPPHHRPHLAASAIDGSEKSELAGPLVNRERERVRDPALAVERGAPGVYNVTDDEPAAVRDWLPVFADAIGAPTPRHVPVWLGRLFGGELGVTMMTELRGASNEKAKRELGWELRYPSWREGFRDGLD
jgi:hypothetical protein